jgi:hypothetical protein
MVAVAGVSFNVLNLKDEVDDLLFRESEILLYCDVYHSASVAYVFVLFFDFLHAVQIAIDFLDDFLEILLALDSCVLWVESFDVVSDVFGVVDGILRVADETSFESCCDEVTVIVRSDVEDTFLCAATDVLIRRFCLDSLAADSACVFFASLTFLSVNERDDDFLFFDFFTVELMRDDEIDILLVFALTRCAVTWEICRAMTSESVLADLNCLTLYDCFASADEASTAESAIPTRLNMLIAVYERQSFVRFAVILDFLDSFDFLCIHNSNNDNCFG